jgi:malonate decarboxylase delta subunit
METLRYRFAGGTPPPSSRAARIVGVVASGNLEVLIEPVAQDGACAVEVHTAAEGFGAIWSAVLDDFFARHPLGDVRVSINDSGATPATVALRLDQAVAEFLGEARR